MTLSDRLAEARAAWPGIELADADFAAYVEARVPAEALAETCVADLWLACAVGRGDAAALRAFDDHCLRDLDVAIAHLDGGSALADDVRAAVRERVLVGGKAKLADYRGRGDLRGWIRVVAVREGLQLLRARRRETPLDRDAELADRIEPTAMTADERRVYREAFETALATLTPRERNLLRQQYVYGATIDELAALYAVHRATVARWVARVRELVLRRTRRHVGEALRLAGDDLDSVMGRIADHLDYSLRHTLSFEDPA
ncbi:MAG: sigma-70 family RNA polymerase sigma factor [Kofleriaceae bacterium]